MSVDLTQLGWQLVAALFAVLSFVAFGPPMRRWHVFMTEVKSDVDEQIERHRRDVKGLLTGHAEMISGQISKFEERADKVDFAATAATVAVHSQSFNQLAKDVDAAKERLSKLEIGGMRRMG